ncbi:MULTISPECIES: UTP--glucose-1-phosphate uridylyltransferase GalU [unclassified Mesorhizobium]|jgi:UTP--glucose-1-phosphate uridylyltransferase|uniref:UTP--glucose-1-phosphate uridylyltransferase GalU n=1 Tax=unclassified Mesorhizobium TaxID=325217 RepID=UPI000FE3C545|nr:MULTISPECIES: UTP--glucose-1-phosphate uridylyltransferase GalU [unclassified Mesorhizobium]MDG4894280.1 UTP--glucose-1-phosphate uridylyltransferase GalU [Mesorhizobium sp. WSM4976]RWB78703.1 MAG: UTP--glucose-1-phosphate uridylyltransferase GalU [Mesorhizobium sp.]RWH72076.1 MAG: UTP--glucose-1-phosphate uridylyltransferase GalU [Mesorhizobium sp.]RWL33084.1 MAG: UTP--glucose-1-phosphate uridylyltransferase GalU [Mesorhizobium sp.]RWL34091.1 MAG: UTP--glucose-1-phosphate uridylyltransfera
MQKVRKAVIPVAGLGTRFLPATKSMPKEMLPVVDKPVVQYAVDEAFEAGIEHIVFVTGRNKAVIEDYFDLHPELIGTLEQTGKKAQLESLESLLPVAGATSFIRQQSPQGLGHAVWCARDVIGNEPFALLLPDMVSFGARGCLAETVDLYQRTGGNVIAVERCDPAETSKYGIVGRGDEVGSGFQVTEMVEKPAPAKAPSNFYINGRYVLQPEIFALLGNQQRGAGNEIQLTDAMVRLAQSQPFYAQPFDGRMFDCGSKEGFIEATIAFALARDDMKGPVLEMLQQFVRSHERREVAA